MVIHGAARHPDRRSLEAFALGRLDTAESPQVEQHLERCAACARLVQEAPDDRLVRLMRRPSSAVAPDLT